MCILCTAYVPNSSKDLWGKDRQLFKRVEGNTIDDLAIHSSGNASPEEGPRVAKYTNIDFMLARHVFSGYQPSRAPKLI